MSKAVRNSSAIAMLNMFYGDIPEKSDSKVLSFEIHQFQTNLLYLPVYMSLEAVKKTMGDRINIKYITVGTDLRTVQSVIDKQNEAWPTNPSRIVLGVSELGQDKREIGAFIEYPFIKRLPLWGVALKNNPNINYFKSGNHREGGDWPTRLSFWNTFGAKLSLLRREDLTDPLARLSASLYPVGTTARYLFDKFLDGRSMAHISEVGFENEFEDLFNGLVDIALTVQPWEAVQQARQRGKDIEVVYVHQGEPEAFSSLYMYSEEESARYVISLLIQAIGEGIQNQVKDLYALKWLRNVDPYIEAMKRVAASANESPPQKKDVDVECALDMLCDSRIYYYDMGAKQKQAHNMPDPVFDQFGSVYQDWYKTKNPDKADLVFDISSIINAHDPLKCHNAIKTVASALKDDPSQLARLKNIAAYLEGDFDQDWSCDQFERKWRGETVSSLLGDCSTWGTESGWREFERNSLWVDLNGIKGPWLPDQALKKGLDSFIAQFRDRDRGRESVCKVIGIESHFIESGAAKILFVLLIYAPINSGVVFSWDGDRVHGGFKKSSFVIQNDKYKDLFGAWWINAHAKKIHHIDWTRNDHIEAPKLSWTEDGKYWVLTKDGQSGKGRMKFNSSSYGLLLSFKVMSSQENEKGDYC